MPFTGVGCVDTCHDAHRHMLRSKGVRAHLGFGLGLGLGLGFGFGFGLGLGLGLG